MIAVGREIVASSLCKSSNVFFGHFHEGDTHAEIGTADAHSLDFEVYVAGFELRGRLVPAG